MAIVNPKKLQAQAAYFNCPEWAAKPTVPHYLEVRKGESVVSRKDVDEHSYYLFGRSHDVCDYSLEHHSVSRVHFALVHHRNGGVFIIDLGSHGGTSIDGQDLQKLQATRLPVGSVLRVATSTRQYILCKNEAEVPKLVARPPAPKRPREDAKINNPPKRLKIGASQILIKHAACAQPFDRDNLPVTRPKPLALQRVKDARVEIMTGVRDGGASLVELFAKIAQKYSDDKSAKYGGQLGMVETGALPQDVERALQDLRVGKVSQPIESEHGFHLLLRTQ
eukprot:TRINITY_DN5900_c0_g1_i1.p1 TRINITY_DN5900_c0_g1~~TRINITY_DN5900_c0_g1_i1.p1  ORF type:complete len:279 (+),score=36.69 TRINITY_DN5900_c0_g1_i1:33-869(+)